MTAPEQGQERITWDRLAATDTEERALMGDARAIHEVVFIWMPLALGEIVRLENFGRREGP